MLARIAWLLANRLTLGIQTPTFMRRPPWLARLPRKPWPDDSRWAITAVARLGERTESAETGTWRTSEDTRRRCWKSASPHHEQPKLPMRPGLVVVRSGSLTLAVR